MLFEHLSCFTKTLWYNGKVFQIWSTIHIFHKMSHMCNCTICSVPTLLCIWVRSQLAHGQLSVYYSVNSELGLAGTFAALTNGSPLFWLCLNKAPQQIYDNILVDRHQAKMSALKGMLPGGYDRPTFAHMPRNILHTAVTLAKTTDHSLAHFFAPVSRSCDKRCNVHHFTSTTCHICQFIV